MSRSVRITWYEIQSSASTVVKELNGRAMLVQMGYSTVRLIEGSSRRPNPRPRATGCDTPAPARPRPTKDPHFREPGHGAASYRIVCSPPSHYPAQAEHDTCPSQPVPSPRYRKRRFAWREALGATPRAATPPHIEDRPPRRRVLLIEFDARATPAPQASRIGLSGGMLPRVVFRRPWSRDRGRPECPQPILGGVRAGRPRVRGSVSTARRAQHR